MMRIGMGATVLANGGRKQALDGIGYYTQELMRELLQLQCDVKPVVFGQTAVDPVMAQAVTHWGRYSTGSLLSAITGCAHTGSRRGAQHMDLFHATDHQIPKLHGIPVLATLMDAIPLAHPEWANARLRKIKNALWKKSATWADHIVTISEYSKLEIVEHFGIVPDKISVVPLGVEERYFTRLPQEQTDQVLKTYQLNADFFLFIGTLQPRKNLQRIIQAHHALPEAIRKAYPLVIIGREGWGSEALVKQLHLISAKDSIHWLGGVSDLHKRALLQRATALVFPSLSEGFGLPVLESFASLTPVITSNNTSLPEVAADAALMVNPLDVAAIAKAMGDICQDMTLAPELRQRGLLRARHFTWRACAQKTYEIYKLMLSGKV